MVTKKEGDAIISKLESKKNDISDQVRILYDSVLAKKPSVLIECGVRTGVSSIAILAACSQYGGKLYSFEIDEQYASTWTRVIRAYPKLAAYWEMMIADDIKVAKEWSFGKVKFIFIDTSHEAEQTRKELVAFTPLLDDDGEMFFHDTQGIKKSGVLPPIQEFIKNNKGWAYKEMGGKQGLGRLTHG